MRPGNLNPAALAAALIGLCFPLTAPAASANRQTADPSQPVTIGRWTSRFIGNGIFLDYDGVPLVKGGLTQVFAKDYSVGYFSWGGPSVTVETLPDGGRAYNASVRHTEDRHTFSADQRIEVHPDNRVVFTIRARWDGQETTVLEWNAARLWSYPLVGSAYTARGGSGAVLASGRIGRRARGDKYPRSGLSAPFAQMTLTGAAVGSIVLTGDTKEEQPVLFDARRDQYLKDEKVFWAGYIGSDMAPGRDVVRAMTLTVIPSGPAPALAAYDRAAKPRSLTAKTVAIPDALLPAKPLTAGNGSPLIVPEPKHVVFAKGNFALRGALPCYTSIPKGEDGRRVLLALNSLTGELKRDTGVKSSPGKGPWNGRGMLVAVVGAGTKGAASGIPSPPDRKEGYALRVTPGAIVVVGHDAAGAFYGLQTLRQLLHTTPAGKFAFAGADITDWPSIAFRAAHIFVGRRALPFHKKLIERVFSRYKLNAIVLECEFSQWKSHPEIHVSNSMPLKDLRADVAFARDRFMEPIPLVNTLGHSEWMFANGKNVDLAEDVSSPHAYDASNPDSYKFVFDIYKEAVDIFHPRLFHIGHDEVKMLGSELFGKYPARPGNIEKGITRLFVDDTNKLADWLRPRGAKVMMWGDMMLYRTEGRPTPDSPPLGAANAVTLEEAKERRGLIPKDAVIADWRYDPGSEQSNGLKIFQDAGRLAVGCPWCEPENIRGWAHQVIKNGSYGMLHTTWAGFDVDESVLDWGFNQFSSFVLTSEYAWSGTQRHPRDPAKPMQSDTLPYDEGDVFARSYEGAPLLASPRAGWCLDLRRAADITLIAEDRGTLPYVVIVGSERGGSAVVLRNPANVGIRLTGAKPVGLMLRGALKEQETFPTSVSLPIHARASALAFLHATGFALESGKRVGTYTVVYRDGKRMEIPLRYGMEIRALDDDIRTAYTTSAVSWGVRDAPLTLRLMRWSNPRPDQEIDQLEFRADDRSAAPALFGVTGIGQ